MFDIQAGARHGEWADLMKPIVAKLTEEDLEGGLRERKSTEDPAT